MKFITERDLRIAQYITETSEQLYVKPSGISGLGLFSKSQIAKGTVLYAFAGQFIQETEIRKFVAEFPELEMGVSRHAGNLFAFAPDRTKDFFTNHSDSPNVLEFCSTAFAMRDLAPDTELTLDYRFILHPQEEMEVEDGKIICGHPADICLRETARLFAQIYA